MNPENIRPPKKGEVRNPNGRKKGVPNRATLVKKWMIAKEQVRNPITKENEWLSQEDMIVLAMIAKARRGNVKAAEFLFDARFGPLSKASDKTTRILAEQAATSISFTVVDPRNSNLPVDVEIGAASNKSENILP